MTRRLPGVEAATLYYQAQREADRIKRLTLHSEAELSAFIAGALDPQRPLVPAVIANLPELAQAYVRGQRERKNEYGFIYLGRWIWHLRDEDAQHNQLDHWLIAP